MMKTLTSVLLSFAIVFQAGYHAPAVHAVSCSNVGGTSGKLKHSGVVNGSSAKVCGKEIWKLVGKPKATPKPKAAPRKTKYRPVRWKNEFSVTPDRPRFWHSGLTSISVGETMEFKSLAVRHVRNRLLLWYPTQVKFKPVESAWDFGDGLTAATDQERHMWRAVGVYQVRLKVSYAVKYKIVGKSDWVKLPGLIVASSLPLTVSVGQSSQLSSPSVVLVHWNCSQRFSSIGC